MLDDPIITIAGSRNNRVTGSGAGHTGKASGASGQESCLSLTSLAGGTTVAGGIPYDANDIHEHGSKMMMSDLKPQHDGSVTIALIDGTIVTFLDIHDFSTADFITMNIS
jgi:hypothetical protein